MKIAVIDLDTSHPEAWIPILREMGHDIAGVWDGGSVHPPGYAQAFAQKLQIPRVFASLEEAAGDVDLAVIHGCDWDTHVEKTRPFLEAGKAVLVDKPVAGNERDLQWFEQWARKGARVTGGSGLRYCAEALQLRDKWKETGATPHTVFCGCGVDEFNYGIHAYALLAAILDADATDVQYLSEHGQQRVLIRWRDGRLGMLVIGPAAKWQPFHASIVTDQGVDQFIANPSILYRTFLGAVMPFLSGATDQPPCPPDAWLAPERWALAALASIRNEGRLVAATGPGVVSVRHDGEAFAQGYRKARYPDAH